MSDRPRLSKFSVRRNARGRHDSRSSPAGFRRPRVERLEDRLLLSLDPSPEAQELLVHLNRMRVDPQGELAVLFTSLNPLLARDPDANQAIDYFDDPTSASIQADWPSLAPVDPLVWNESLYNAALSHSELMRQRDEQSHQLTGEPSYTERFVNAGYTGLMAAGENIFAYAKSPFHAHSAFAIDWGVPSRGHRLNIMDGSFREVGIGVVADSSSSTQVGPLLVTQDFASRAGFGGPYLVGVAYADSNGNGRYNVGEGRGSVQITLSGAAGTFVTTTMSAGGYQIQVPPGDYMVTASGGSFAGTSRVPVRVGGSSVEVDFVSGLSTGYVNFDLWQNTAPALNPGTNPHLTAVLMGTANPVGDSVASVVRGSITDPDLLAQQGIAVTGLTGTGSGVWQYSTNAGMSWNAIAPVASNSALLLRDTDFLRFVPNAGFSGTASITYHAWDQTSATAGSRVNLGTGTGGTTAWSTASATATCAVLAGNTAPVLDNSLAPSLPAAPEDSTNPRGIAVYDFAAAGIHDADPGAAVGIALVGLSGTAGGTWQFSLDGGNSWQAFGAISDAAAILLRDSDQVRFVPRADFFGTAALSYRAWDRTSGSAGASVDLSAPGAVGGSTAFSTAVETATVEVTAVNDAPLLDVNYSPRMTAIPSGAAWPAGDRVGDIVAHAIRDADPAALEGIALIGADTSQGSWQFNTGGSEWWYLPSYSPQWAVLLRADDRLRFVPNAGFTGTVTFTFRAWDQTTGSAGDMVDLQNESSRGGTTAFSAQSDTGTIYVGSQPPATIRGHVFHDLDGNGGQESGEPALSQKTLYLDQNGNGLLDSGEPQAISDWTGLYEFVNLAPGSYTVRQVMEPGWRRSVPDTGFHPVTVGFGEVASDRHFGNVYWAAAVNTVDFLALLQRNLSGGTLWYPVQTAHSGILTAQTAYDPAGGSVRLTLYSLSGQELGSSQSGGGQDRVDWEVAAGEPYLLELSGTHAGVDMRVANLVQRVGSAVTVWGTAGADQFTFNASAGKQIAINGIRYDFHDAVSFAFDGASGEDEVHWTGSAAAEVAILRPTAAVLRSDSYTVSAARIESSRFDGGDGDVVRIHGTHRANTLAIGGETPEADPRSAALTGGGTSIAVIADRVIAQGRGGRDAAMLHQPAENEVLESYWKWTRMRGPDGYHELRGFEDVSIDAAFASLQESDASSADNAVLQGTSGPTQDYSRDDLAATLWLYEVGERHFQDRRAVRTREIDSVDRVFASWDPGGVYVPYGPR